MNNRESSLLELFCWMYSPSLNHTHLILWELLLQLKIHQKIDRNSVFASPGAPPRPSHTCCRSFFSIFFILPRSRESLLAPVGEKSRWLLGLKTVILTKRWRGKFVMHHHHHCKHIRKHVFHAFFFFGTLLFEKKRRRQLHMEGCADVLPRRFAWPFFFTFFLDPFLCVCVLFFFRRLWTFYLRETSS